MSYLSHLVGRTLGSARVAQPVLRGSFAPRSLSTPGPEVDDAPATRTDVADGHAGLERAQLAQAPAASPMRAVDSRAERRNAMRLAAASARPVRRTEHSAPGEPERFQLVNSVDETSAKQSIDLHAGSFPPAAEPVAAAEASLHAGPSSAAAGPVSERAAGDRVEPVHAPGSFRLVRPRMQSAPRVDVATRQSSADAEGPVVRVQIGRVDVRLVTQNQADKASPAPRGAEARPVPLEDYLKARERGQR